MSLQLAYDLAREDFQRHKSQEPAVVGSPEHKAWAEAHAQKLAAYLKAADEIIQMERKEQETAQE